MTYILMHDYLFCLIRNSPCCVPLPMDTPSVSHCCWRRKPVYWRQTQLAGTASCLPLTTSTGTCVHSGVYTSCVHVLAHLTVVTFSIVFHWSCISMFLYRQTALAILRDKEQGFKALKCVAIDEETTPLRLLIKEMPGEK